MTQYILCNVKEHKKMVESIQPIYTNNDVNANYNANAVEISHTLHTYLNMIKSKLDFNQDNWDKYKKYTNPYEYIHTIIPNTKQAVCCLKPLSRSFYKMIEIANDMSLLKRLPSTACKTFHLAEGPGGFIEAMAYMRRNLNDVYYGMTLIDDTNQNVPGWRKSKHFLNNNPNVIIEKGHDGTGNIINADNLRFCYEKYKGTMDLVTADGGFDFTLHYTQQEVISTNLIFCQIAFALAIQKPGGDFVIKIFDTFSKISLDMLYLLSVCYERVHFMKPQTSRYANSEKYVICHGFRSTPSKTDEIIRRLYLIIQSIATPPQQLYAFFNFPLPYIFVNQIEEYNAIICQQQIENILTTLSFIDNTNNRYENLEKLKKLNIQKCMGWCQKYNLPYYKIIQTNNIFHSRVNVYSNLHHNHNNNHNHNHNNNHNNNNINHISTNVLV